MMIGVQGTEANEDALYVLHQFHYGGIILFDRNLESKAQTKLWVRIVFAVGVTLVIWLMYVQLFDMELPIGELFE